MKTTYKAKIDGREVPVDIIEEGVPVGRTERKTHVWQGVLPLVMAGVVLVGIAFLSISLFIWLLPVLLPVVLILLVVRMIRQA